MKKIVNISFTLFAVACLSFFMYGFVVAQFFGETSGDLGFNEQEIIPQGRMTYGLYFAEFGGRMQNLPVEIVISGNKITVYNNKENPLTGGEIITEGTLMKHTSGTWIIGKTEADRYAEEIGGCVGVIPIYFETKIIEWC